MNVERRILASLGCVRVRKRRVPDAEWLGKHVPRDMSLDRLHPVPKNVHGREIGVSCIRRVYWVGAI